MSFDDGFRGIKGEIPPNTPYNLAEYSPSLPSFSEKEGSKESVRRSHSRLLAKWIDAGKGPLSRALAFGDAANLREAFSQLSQFEKESLKTEWGGALSKLLSLGEEEHEGFFHRGALALGSHWENKGDIPGAVQWYHHILAEIPDPEIKSQAQENITAIAGGKGALGERLGFLTNHLIDEVFSLPTLVSMGVGGLVFRMARFAAAMKLKNLPAGLWTRDLGARISSGMVGTLAEAPVFAVTGKALRTLRGDAELWNNEALFHEIKGGFYLLGGLRAFGWAGTRLAQQIHGIHPVTGQALRLQNWFGLTKFVSTQGGMWSGISVGHSLAGEKSTWIEDLHTLLQFNLMGVAFRGLMPEKIKAFEKQLDRRMEGFFQGRIQLSPRWAGVLGAGLAMKPALAQAAVDSGAAASGSAGLMGVLALGGVMAAIAGSGGAKSSGRSSVNFSAPPNGSSIKFISPLKDGKIHIQVDFSGPGDKPLSEVRAESGLMEVLYPELVRSSSPLQGPLADLLRANLLIREFYQNIILKPDIQLWAHVDQGPDRLRSLLVLNGAGLPESLMLLGGNPSEGSSNNGITQLRFNYREYLGPTVEGARLEMADGKLSSSSLGDARYNGYQFQQFFESDNVKKIKSAESIDIQFGENGNPELRIRLDKKDKITWSFYDGLQKEVFTVKSGQRGDMPLRDKLIPWEPSPPAPGSIKSSTPEPSKNSPVQSILPGTIPFLPKTPGASPPEGTAKAPEAAGTPKPEAAKPKRKKRAAAGSSQSKKEKTKSHRAQRAGIDSLIGELKKSAKDGPGGQADILGRAYEFLMGMDPDKRSWPILDILGEMEIILKSGDPGVEFLKNIYGNLSKTDRVIVFERLTHFLEQGDFTVQSSSLKALKDMLPYFDPFSLQEIFKEFGTQFRRNRSVRKKGTILFQAKEVFEDRFRSLKIPIPSVMGGMIGLGVLADPDIAQAATTLGTSIGGSGDILPWLGVAATLGIGMAMGRGGKSSKAAAPIPFGIKMELPGHWVTQITQIPFLKGGRKSGRIIFEWVQPQGRDPVLEEGRRESFQESFRELMFQEEGNQSKNPLLKGAMAQLLRDKEDLTDELFTHAMHPDRHVWVQLDGEQGQLKSIAVLDSSKRPYFMLWKSESGDGPSSQFIELRIDHENPHVPEISGREYFLEGEQLVRFIRLPLPIYNKYYGFEIAEDHVQRRLAKASQLKVRFVEDRRIKLMLDIDKGPGGGWEISNGENRRVASFSRAATREALNPLERFPTPQSPMIKTTPLPIPATKSPVLSSAVAVGLEKPPQALQKQNPQMPEGAQPKPPAETNHQQSGGKKLEDAAPGSSGDAKGGPSRDKKVEILQPQEERPIRAIRESQRLYEALGLIPKLAEMPQEQVAAFHKYQVLIPKLKNDDVYQVYHALKKQHSKNIHWRTQGTMLNQVRRLLEEKLGYRDPVTGKLIGGLVGLGILIDPEVAQAMVPAAEGISQGSGSGLWLAGLLSLSAMVGMALGRPGKGTPTEGSTDGGGENSGPSGPIEIPREMISKSGRGRRGSFPYKVRLEPLENFFQKGHEGIMAYRDNRTIRMKVKDTRIVEDGDSLFPQGARLVDVSIFESSHHGDATFYYHEGRLTYTWVDVSHMLWKGVGTIFNNWLASQAAWRGEEFEVRTIGNPRILDIVRDNQLMDPNQNTVERIVHSSHGNVVVSSGNIQDPGAAGKLGSEGWLNIKDWINIRGRPNPDLIPEELKKVKKD